MKVDQCSLIKPVTCTEHQTITEIAQLMEKCHSRHVYVVRDHVPLGIISIVDIVHRVVAQKKDPQTTKAVDIMTAPLECVEHSLPVEKAYLRMIQKNVYALPITEQGKLIGILPLSNVGDNGVCK